MAHLLSTPQDLFEQPVGDRGILRDHVDVDHLSVAFAEGGCVPDCSTASGEHQPAIGCAVEAGLGEIVGDVVQRAVRESDHSQVVRRDQLEERLGIAMLRWPDGVCAGQYGGGLHELMVEAHRRTV
jgi:hypothetical protein